MSITLDQPLGSTTGLTTGFTGVATITTTNAAAAGSRVVVTYSFFVGGGSPTPTCTVGGVSATLDKQNTNGTDIFAVFSLVVAGGLASSSSIVCSPGGGSAPGGGLACACSYLGTTGVDTNSSNSTTLLPFSSGAATNAVADALFVGGAGNETASTSVGGTNTNGTPRFDIWNSAAGQGMRMLDLIASSIANQALTGTWANTSTATTGALVIYSGTASGAPLIPQPLLTLMGVPMFGQQPPLPFGLIPDQPPVQTPSGIWLPATTTPSPRNRSFFVVRGRQVKAVPNQETPIVEQRSPGVRREPPRLSRGARSFPVQPQTAPVSKASRSRLSVRLHKGRVVTPVPLQATVILIWVPRQVPGHRRVVQPPKGRVFAPVPAQVTVPVLVFPNRVDSQRSNLAALQRGKRWDVIPPQVVVVSVWIPTFISPNSTFY